MIRDHDALVRYLAARVSRPFDWGRNSRGPAAADEGNSCVHYAAGAVLAQTGRNIMAEIPAWSSERGARRVIRRLGGLEAGVARVLREIPPALAQRGDIAGVVGDSGELFLMVVEGDALSGPGASGARRLRRARMIKAWSAT